jgi:hypothetical protein
MNKKSICGDATQSLAACQKNVANVGHDKINDGDDDI